MKTAGRRGEKKKGGWLAGAVPHSVMMGQNQREARGHDFSYNPLQDLPPNSRIIVVTNDDYESSNYLSRPPSHQGGPPPPLPPPPPPSTP